MPLSELHSYILAVLPCAAGNGQPLLAHSRLFYCQNLAMKQNLTSRHLRVLRTSAVMVDTPKPISDVGYRAIGREIRAPEFANTATRTTGSDFLYEAPFLNLHVGSESSKRLRHVYVTNACHIHVIDCVHTHIGHKERI